VKNKQVSEDAKPWNAGYAAGMRGVARVDNPYPVGSDDALAWTAGHIEGSAQLRKLGAK
jgi:hypothetical protein